MGCSQFITIIIMYPPTLGTGRYKYARMATAAQAGRQMASAKAWSAWAWHACISLRCEMSAGWAGSQAWYLVKADGGPECKWVAQAGQVPDGGGLLPAARALS